MTPDEFNTWLLQEAIHDEYRILSKIFAACDLKNIAVDPELSKQADSLDWRRLLFAASILAKSDSHNAETAALKIATAGVVLGSKPEIVEASAVLLDKLSNNLSLRLAERRNFIKGRVIPKLGVAGRIEAARRSVENSVLLQHTGRFLPANRFQRDFWRHAGERTNWLSVSSPTASGKSYIVIQWLLDQILSEEISVVIYLAPTRALVSEVEETLTSKLGDQEVQQIKITSIPLTGVIEQAHREGKKIIIVATQERLQVFMNVLSEKLRVNLLVVDEAHKIADRMRGLILQDSVERVARIYPACRIVFISPSTQNPDILLEDAPADVRGLAVRSQFSTVVQNLFLVTQVPRKPKQWMFSTRFDGDLEQLGIVTLPNSPSSIKKSSHS